MKLGIEKYIWTLAPGKIWFWSNDMGGLSE